MNSTTRQTNALANTICRFFFSKNASPPPRQTQRRLGFESLESRRVLCTVAPILPEAISVVAFEANGPVHQAIVAPLPAQSVPEASLSLAQVQTVDLPQAVVAAVYGNEQAIGQLLSPITKLGEFELDRAEGEDPAPGPTPPSPNEAPVITSFSRDQSGTTYTFEGNVEDDKSTEGLVVQFSGVFSASTSVDAQGHFLYVTTLPLNTHGVLTAQTIDRDGNPSNVKTLFM